MKTHLIIPAIASLALFAVNPASASTLAAKALQGAKIENSKGGAVVAEMSRARYECSVFFSRAGRMRCYQMHGLAAPRGQPL